MGNDQAPRRPGRAPPGRVPTSRSGSCRSYRRYRRQLDSTIADMKNMGGGERRRDHRGAVPRGVRRRTCPGRTSTSPARRRPTDGRSGATRAPPASAAALLVELACAFEHADACVTRSTVTPDDRQRGDRADDGAGAAPGGRAGRTQRLPRRDRAARQQGAAPGDDLPRPHHRRHRAVGVLFARRRRASRPTSPCPTPCRSSPATTRTARSRSWRPADPSRPCPATRSRRETIPVKSLLSADGIRFIFTSACRTSTTSASSRSSSSP